VITLCNGKQRRIVWGEDASGGHRGKDYFEALDESERAKFVPLFEHLSENAQMHNDTRFKKEMDGIFCLKSGAHRLACFFRQGDLVIISGFQKKARRGRRAARHLKAAVELRKEYLERRESKR
jgi:mRNA-degrading endonuclease RelE of RelBE toxin-antitoxin system